MDSFSIREYVWKSRSVEGRKQRCWPFNGEPEALPAMNMKKFKWWENEAERVKVEGGGASTQADQLNTSEDSRLVKCSGRTKQRTPKKRSIVELFAVAPPIGSVQDGGGIDEIENRSGVDFSHVKKDGVQEKEGCVKSMREIPEEISVRKKKLKKKKRNLNTEIICTAKSARQKSKKVLPHDVPQLLQGSFHKKRFLKTFQNISIRRKNNLVSKGVERKHKHAQNLKAIQRNKKDTAKVLPIHGILKNRSKGTLKKLGGKDGPCDSNRTKTNCDLRKHVTFSGKDDILGNNEGCSLVELPRLKKLCKIFSDVLAASSVMNSACKSDKFLLAVEEPEALNISEKFVSVEIAENRAGSSCQKQQASDAPNHHSPTTFEKSSIMAKCSLVEPVDLNREVQSNACLDVSRVDCSNFSACRLFPGSQAQVSPLKEGLNSEVKSHAEESHCRLTGASHLSAVAAYASWPDVVSSEATTGNSLRTSMTGSVTSEQPAERIPQASTDSQGGICRYTPEKQISCPSQESSKSTCCPSVGSIEFVQPRMLIGQAKFGHQGIQSGMFPICDSKCIDEGFVGLPLNSHGEFIRNPSSKSGFSELYRKHNPNLLSLYNCPSSSPELTSSMDQPKVKEKFPGEGTDTNGQLYLQPEQHHSPGKVLTYGSGCIQLHGHGRPQAQGHDLVQEIGLQMQNDLRMEASCHGCEEQNRSHPCVHTMRQRAQVEGHCSNRFQPALQPTMRLMGKNVTVGKSSNDCLSFDEGKLWTDKEIIIEDPLSVRLPESSISKCWAEYEKVYQVDRMTRGDLLHSLQTPSNFFQASNVAERSDKMHFGLGPKLVSRDGQSLPLGSRRSLDSLNHPPPPTVPCGKTLGHPLKCKPMPEFIEVGRQLPIRPHPQDAYQRIMLGSTHCKHSQSISFELSPESSLQPRCLNQMYLSFANPSFGNSLQNLPQWQLDASQNRQNQRSCCSSYSNPAAFNWPCNFRGVNTFPCGPPLHTPVVPFPAYGIVNSQACGPSAPASLRRTSVTPQFATNYSSSTISGMYQAKMPNWHATNLNFIYPKRSGSTRTRKRKAAKGDRCLKSAKKPSQSTQHDLNTRMAQVGKEQLQGSGRLNSGTSDANVTETITMSHTVEDVEKGDSGSVPRCASDQKIDATTKSGPFKLCAGAKHILKPGQAVDGDNSRTVHSAAPFVIENSSSSVPAQKKATKIYTF